MHQTTLRTTWPKKVKLLKTVEHTVANVEIAHYEQIRPLPQCFQKSSVMLQRRQMLCCTTADSIQPIEIVLFLAERKKQKERETKKSIILPFPIYNNSLTDDVCLISAQYIKNDNIKIT